MCMATAIENLNKPPLPTAKKKACKLRRSWGPNALGAKGLGTRLEFRLIKSEQETDAAGPRSSALVHSPTAHTQAHPTDPAETLAVFLT